MIQDGKNFWLPTIKYLLENDCRKIIEEIGITKAKVGIEYTNSNEGQVVLEKVYAHQMELSRADISNFFGIKAEQSEIVANFKETTLKRLRAAYIELLIGAGYTVKNENEFSLTTPIAVYQICNYLEEIGEKRYAKAMLGV